VLSQQLSVAVAMRHPELTKLCLDKLWVASLPEPVKMSNPINPLLKRPPSKMVNMRFCGRNAAEWKLFYFSLVSLLAPVLKFMKWYTLPSVKLNDIQMTILKLM
jgi:hypothetical protein